MGNGRTGTYSRQLMQLPLCLHSRVLSLVVHNDLDATHSPVTNTLVAELCALGQLASQPSVLSFGDMPAAGSNGHSAAGQSIGTGHRMAAGYMVSSREDPAISSAAQASAQALARFLLDEVFLARQHPTQHAHVLAAAAVLDSPAADLQLEVQLRRIKRAAALLDEAVEVVSSQLQSEDIGGISVQNCLYHRGYECSTVICSASVLLYTVAGSYFASRSQSQNLLASQ